YKKHPVLSPPGDMLKPRQRRGDDNRVNSLRFFNACACFLAVQRWHVMCNNVRVDAHSISYVRLLAS
ncbi:hypothetical protein E4Y15_19860, partial [Salmonella enterica]|nr:hypothetical protein [Salmonella enterica]